MNIEPIEIVSISKNYAPVFRKMLHYLQDTFHIKNFTYKAIFENKYYFQMATNIDHLEMVLTEGIHAKCPILNSTNKSQIPSVFMPHLLNKTSHDVLEKILTMCKKYDMNQPIVISKLDDNIQETFAFYHESNNNSVINYYLNIMPDLYDFICHFKKEIHEIIKKEIATLPLKADIFCEEKTNSLFEESETEFFYPINEPKIPQFNSLSLREKQILSYYLKGKNAQDIADILYLSPRTIQNNSEQIKSKLGCRTLPQLLARFIDNKTLLDYNLDLGARHL